MITNERCPYCNRHLELTTTKDGMYLFKCSQHLYLTAMKMNTLVKRLNELTREERIRRKNKKEETE